MPVKVTTLDRLRIVLKDENLNPVNFFYQRPPLCSSFQKDMGSIEVYDYKLQKWVPYVSDPDKWYHHFLDLRDGYVQPDHLGRYIVGSGDKYRKL